MTYHQTPILFIPGLFGCMSSQIIAGTGSWQFGFSKSMYTPFIDLLKNNGIYSSHHLFTLFYDWRKSTPYNIKNYLLPTLEKIKNLSHSNELHIIAHGTGGYLARYYIQNITPSLHIKTLILVGTPNAGFASSFSYLTGGELHMSCNIAFDFINLYLRMHLYKNLPPKLSPLEFLQKQFPALLEMVPSNFYSDYLFYRYDKKQCFIPYHSMIVTNEFLDQLNAPFHPYPQNTQVHLIAGEGHPTIEHFEIMPICCNQWWVDGKVIDCIDTLEGDGINLVRSVFSTDGIQHLVTSHYETLLVNAAPIYLPLITS